MLIAVFLSIFALVTLALLVFSSGNRANKQTIARLESIRSGPQDPLFTDEPLVVRRTEVLSTIPLFDRWLQQMDLAPKIRLLLYQADVSMNTGSVLLMSLLVGLVLGWAVDLRTGSLFMATCFALGGGSLPFVYVFRKRSQRFDQLKQRLPEALDLMVAAIRAGHSFASAMGMAARESSEPLKRELRQCYDEQNFGLDLRQAMANLAYRVPTRDIRMITAAVLIQKETGGNLTEILEKVSTLIREDFRLQRQVRVHTAQGRLTGWILSILPLVLGAALYLVNPKQMSILWERPVGLKLLNGAAVMTTIGGLIIRKIVRIRI